PYTTLFRSASCTRRWTIARKRSSGPSPAACPPSWPMLVFLRKVIVDLLVSGGPEPAVTSGQPEDLRWPFAHRYSAAAAPAPQPETAKLQKITHTPLMTLKRGADAGVGAVPQRRKWQ